MPRFEVFVKQQMAPLSRTPHVAIQRRGRIQMDRTAYGLLGSPRAVELLYDLEEQIVGIRAADPSVAHAYHVQTGDGRGPFVVSGAAFVKHYGIETSVGRRWVAQMDGEILCVDLKTAPVTTGNREVGTEPSPSRTRRPDR